MLNTEVNDSDDVVAAKKVVRILVYQQDKTSKLIKTPQAMHVKCSLLQWKENEFTLQINKQNPISFP